MLPEQDKSPRENADPTRSGSTPTSGTSPRRYDIGMASAIESLVRFAGAGLFVVYAAGFVILSVYESSFGIAQFNPFRTKIIAAGMVFCCLASLPVVALFLDFLPGVPVTSDSNLPIPELAQRNQERTVGFSQFVSTSILLALLSSFLFTLDQGPPRPAVLVYFIILAIIFHVKSSRVVRNRFTTRPRAAILLSGLSMGVMLAALYWLDSGIVTLMVLWFFFVGLSAGAIWSSEDKIRYLLNWRRWPVALILIAVYANFIYGRIQAKYGGGAPVPVTFCLDKPPAWIGSTTFRASLIDETDHGFYVLLPRNEKALFIPRSTVLSLYFDSKEPHISAK